QWKEGRPQTADSGGAITLLPIDATLEGALESYPMDQENLKPPYPYTYGRQLHAERQSRKLKGWSGSDTAATWQFRTTASRHSVGIEYATETAESVEATIELNGVASTVTLPGTDSDEVWALGNGDVLTLVPDDVNTITVRAGEGFRLKGLRLDPASN
ncbi:MAG: hypothetical protein AAF514_11285, partial [Verrucomicrobiota bacterium]